jgi:carboxypeptidase family protein/TonB-dependent receptor-like protein
VRSGEVRGRVERVGPAVVRASLVLALLGGVSQAASGQEAALQGRVRDAQSATVGGAAVVVRQGSGTAPLRLSVTDDLGYYRIDELPVIPLVIEISRFGFSPYTAQIQLQPGETRTLDVELQIEPVQVEGLRVEATRRVEETSFDLEAGLTVRAIDAEELRTLPGFIEADPLRAAEALPGVITTNDFSAAFNVRGGSSDQNLILLDGLPLFNPAHLGGLVSVFNPDMVRRASLQSGGFPAEYGGRVSSVLEIESDPGTGDFGVEAGVSLLTGRVTAGGGLSEGVKNKLGLLDAKWRIGGRRSYLDVLLAPFFDVPYRLADAQAVFEGWTRGGNRISFTGYSGGDVLDLTSIDSEDFPLRIDWDWGNDLIGGRWTHLRPGGGVVDVRLGYSRFNTGLVFPDFQDTELRSAISQSTLAADWEHRPARGVVTKIGVEGRRLSYDNRIASGGTEFAGGEGSGWGGAGFAQLQWRTGSWLLEGGVRLDGWYPDDWGSSWEVSPRLSVKRFLVGGAVAVKGSVGRFTQFLHSVRDEELPLGLDVWVLTGPQAPRVVSDQAQAGIEVSPGGGWLLSAEGYVRDFDGVVTTNFADDPNDDFDDYLPGRGRSYGVDLFARRFEGETTGWLAVGWLQARRTFPDFNSGQFPPPEVEYAPIFDRRWDVDLVLSRSLGDRVEAGLRWNFGTGLPFTRPIASFPFLSPQVGPGVLEWDLEGEELGEDDGAGPGNRRFGVLLGPRNGARYPVRHRLDVSIRKRYDRDWGSFTPYLNVINVYNRQNVLFYFFEYDKDPPVRSGISMFPLLPTIGLEMRFR